MRHDVSILHPKDGTSLLSTQDFQRVVISGYQLPKLGAADITADTVGCLMAFPAKKDQVVRIVGAAM